jgi:hypothetical protein
MTFLLIFSRLGETIPSPSNACLKVALSPDILARDPAVLVAVEHLALRLKQLDWTPKVRHG